MASLMSSTRVLSFRSSWWLPLELVNISTPSRPMRMCGLQQCNGVERLSNADRRSFLVHLDGVKSSSQSSTPMHVSIVLTTQSPNGTLT